MGAFEDILLVSWTLSSVATYIWTGKNLEAEHYGIGGRILIAILGGIAITAILGIVLFITTGAAFLF